MEQGRTVTQPTKAASNLSKVGGKGWALGRIPRPRCKSLFHESRSRVKNCESYKRQLLQNQGLANPCTACGKLVYFIKYESQ